MALLDRIVELAHSDELRLDMAFEPGDIQLLNNWTAVHWRTGFTDWPEPDRKRLLYRLWIDRPGERPVDPAMHRGYPEKTAVNMKAVRQSPFAEVPQTYSRIAFIGQVLSDLQAAEEGIHHFIFAHGILAGPEMAAVRSF